MLLEGVPRARRSAKKTKRKKTTPALFATATPIDGPHRGSRVPSGGDCPVGALLGWRPLPRGPRGHPRSGLSSPTRRSASGQLANFAKFCKILQIFSGLVLGCIKTKFCKKICVRQHFSSSTRFASFCTAAISKFSQKFVLKIQQNF